MLSKTSSTSLTATEFCCDALSAEVGVRNIGTACAILWKTRGRSTGSQFPEKARYQVYMLFAFLFCVFNCVWPGFLFLFLCSWVTGTVPQTVCFVLWCPSLLQGFASTLCYCCLFFVGCEHKMFVSCCFLCLSWTCPCNCCVAIVSSMDTVPKTCFVLLVWPSCCLGV